MDYSKIYPFWDKLNNIEKTKISNSCYVESYNKGAIIHRAEDKCKGLITVLSGQLRIYILSDEGREVTLFRIYSSEVCVLSASCLMDSIDFDVIIEANDNTKVLVLPAISLNEIVKNNVHVDLYLNKTANEKFSDVMWSMQQILFKKIDQRIAELIIEEANTNNSSEIKITHDEIAKYIGSAREVVTKVLKYFAEQNIIELGRGKIIITDKNKLMNYL